MLEGIDHWPVPHVAAVAVDAAGRVVEARGETDRPFRLASISKPLTAWATLIAVEEGIVSLDDPVGQPELHAAASAGPCGWLPVRGSRGHRRPRDPPDLLEHGIELAAAHVEQAAGIPFATYLAEAVLQPLGMASAVLHGSPAHAVHATAPDVARFLAETAAPRLLSAAQAREAVTAQYPTLAGIVPGIGRLDPCPWGLGIER